MKLAVTSNRNLRFMFHRKSQLQWPQAAAELRSAWTGEAPVPTRALLPASFLPTILHFPLAKLFAVS
jgi:hypothetical protein